MDGSPAHWFYNVGGDFREWHQYKCALGHARMRNNQILARDTKVIIQENIDINGTRPITNGYLPSQSALDLFHKCQQLLWQQSSDATAKLVEKARLLKIAYRFGFVERRKHLNLHRCA